MNDIDKKIRKSAKKVKLAEDPAYEKQLILMAEDLVKQSMTAQKRACRKSYYMKYTAAAIVTIVIAVYPVKAAADYAAARMAGISEEEKNELRTMVYESDKQNRNVEKEAIRYSRDFSESEQELYDSLLEQYENGVFPKGTLCVSDEVHAADAEQICYNPIERYMYLPDRELTEEDLLEMIDFYYKTDYSLRTSDASIKYKKDMENQKSQVPADALSEDEAMAFAASYVKKMYGISTENMDQSFSGDSPNYRITFVADNASYSVSIQAEDGSFRDISMDQEGFIYYQDNLKVNKSQIQKKGKEAKIIAEQLLGEELTITDTCAQYKLNTEGQIPHGSIVYLFDLNNGSRLRMSYSAAEDVLWGAAIEKGGAGHKDWNVKNDEKRIYLQID